MGTVHHQNVTPMNWFLAAIILNIDCKVDDKWDCQDLYLAKKMIEDRQDIYSEVWQDPLRRMKSYEIHLVDSHFQRLARHLTLKLTQIQADATNN